MMAVVRAARISSHRPPVHIACGSMHPTIVTCTCGCLIYRQCFLIKYQRRNSRTAYWVRNVEHIRAIASIVLVAPVIATIISVSCLVLAVILKGLLYWFDWLCAVATSNESTTTDTVIAFYSPALALTVIGFILMSLRNTNASS